MNDIFIEDNEMYNDYGYLYDVLNAALNHEKISNASCSIIFVDDDEIRRINREYRNIDRITDVISFAFEDNDKIVYNDMRLLGDIFISIPQMKRQASDYENSEKRELSFLAVHGLLHLLGYDHVNNKEEEKIMFDLQERLLNEICITR